MRTLLLSMLLSACGPTCFQDVLPTSPDAGEAMEDAGCPAGYVERDGVCRELIQPAAGVDGGAGGLP